MLMKFNRVQILLTLLLVYSFLSPQVKTALNRFEPDPQLEKEVPVVRGYRDKMPQANVFIFNSESIPTKIISEDRLDAWQTALIIYRPTVNIKRLNRKVLSMKKMKFLCGLGKLCPIDEFYSKVTPDQINIPDMKLKINTFLSLIGSSKTCYADLYSWKGKFFGLVICATAVEAAKFPLLFKNLNPSDYKDVQSSSINSSEKKTLELYISDGYKAMKKQSVTFDSDGIMIDGKFTIYYKNLETFEGEKCKVRSAKSVVPARLLELEQYKPNCVIAFQYNKMKTYFAYKGENCDDVANYIIGKMQQSCLRSINGPTMSWKSELYSLPESGRWKGYVFYHKVLDNGGTLSAIPVKLYLDESKFYISDPYGTKIANFNFRDFNLYCNEDASCSINGFVKHLTDTNTETKLKDFKTVVDKINTTWKFQDYFHCFVLEDKDVHIICPSDYSEEANLKQAFSKSMDLRLQNAPTDYFRTALVGSKYQVVYTSDSSNSITETEIIATNKSLISTVDNKELVDFRHIKSSSGVACGVDLKAPHLPGQLHEMRPNCCARIRAEENFFFCLTMYAKCYKHLRELTNLIRVSCLVAQGLKDPSAISNFSGSAWSGNVVFMEINNYGNKGLPVIDTGLMSVSTDKVRFEGKKTSLEYRTETSNFICGVGKLCTLEQFKDSQEPFFNAGTDQNWFRMQIDSFQETVQNQFDIEHDCFVFVSKRVSGDSDAVLHCSTDKQQIPSMSAVVPNAFAKRVESISTTNPDFEQVPTASAGREFKALVISGNDSTDLSQASPRENRVQINSTSLNYQPSNDLVFNYIDLVSDDQEKYKYGLERTVEGLPKKIAAKNMNKNCCFKATTQSKNFWFICFSEYPECVYQKMITVRFIEENLASQKKRKRKVS